MYRKRVGITTKATAVAIVVILVILGVAGAYYYFTLPTKPPPGGNITVGFSISQTGSFNVEGGASLNGIKTATQWVNTHGGVIVGGKSYNISLDFYDDASTSSNINNLYAKIVQQDHAQFLLAPYSSGLTAVAAPLAEQFNLIMLSHGGSADTLWTQGYKNLFGVLSPASVYLRGAVDWLKANHPNDKLAFVYANDAFSVVAANSSITYAKQQGFQVVYTQSYATTVNDLTPTLTAAKNAGADDLLGGGHFNDGLLITKQLQQVGWTPKFVSLIVAVTEPSFQSQLGNAANGVTGPSQWDGQAIYTPDQAKSLGIEFYGPIPTDFIPLYQTVSGGKSPTYHSGEAGASIFVLAYAIQKANSFDTTAVRQVLSGMHIMTFFGQFQVDSTGKQSAHPMVLIQWQSGALKVVAPTQVATATTIYPYGT